MLGAASHRPVPTGPAVPSGPMSRRRRVLSHCRSRPAPFWKAKQQQTFNQALPPPEYPSLGNQSRYTRLFLTTSLAGATNWSRAACRFMRKWATKSRMLTVEFDAAANIGASGAYRVSRRESQEELRNMCIRVNAAHLRKAEQLRHPEASVRPCEFCSPAPIYSSARSSLAPLSVPLWKLPCQSPVTSEPNPMVAF